MNTRLILIFALMATLWGCSSDDDSTSLPANTLYDIMTLKGRTSEGLVLECQRTQGAQALIFTAKGVNLNPDEFPDGCRILAGYVMASTQATADVSGPITLLGVGKVLQSDVKMVSEAQASDPVEVYSVWRTGRWLNVHTGMLYAKEPKCVEMVCTGLEDDIWQMHLTYQPDTETEATVHNRYCSFALPADVADSGKGIVVHVHNSRQPQSFTIQP